MKRAVTNIAASVRQRLLNEAKRRGESFDYVASLYARERFLARLAVSPHRDRLILKGATVFALWLDDHRSTRDLDFLGRGNFEPEAATVMLREIVGIPMANDGLEFDVASVTATLIRESDEYQGIRIHLVATLDTARIRLQLDIGIGDVVTPPARTATLPSILPDFAGPKVKVYPPETIVSEKLHAMVKFGIANSRMKDFFDIYVLARGHDFEERLLIKAITRTFERRKTAIPEEPFALTPEFYADRAKQTQWRAFLTKNGVNAPDVFSEVGDLLRDFLSPVLASARRGTARGRRWQRGSWRNAR